jgi:hypothetical protein
MHFISQQVQAAVRINRGHHHSEKGSTNTELNKDILVLFSHNNQKSCINTTAISQLSVSRRIVSLAFLWGFAVKTRTRGAAHSAARTPFLP